MEFNGKARINYQLSIINKMLPPQRMTVPEIAQLENIPFGTLYTWMQQYLKNKSKKTPLMASSHTQCTAENSLQSSSKPVA